MPPINQSTQLTFFTNYLKSKSYTNTTIATILKKTRLHLKWLDKENMEIEQVGYNDLMAYMKYKSRKGASQRTIQHDMGVIKHYYEYLLNNKNITTNPASDITIKGVKRKVLYHILKPNELHQLYHHYQIKKSSTADSRNKVMLGLLIYQGITTSELAKLEVNHIKLREGKIQIVGSHKSNERTLTLESYQMMELYDYTEQTRPKLLQDNLTEKLFISEGGNSDVPNYMAAILKRLRKQSPKLKNARQLRASVITKWLKQYNLREVQYLAGHRYISSTESYLENDLEGLQEEVQQFHPLG